MRLIDADELRSGMFHLEGETSITDRQLGYQAGWNDALMYAVDDAPTVDAEPVRHGHWVLVGFVGQGTRLSKCSICGRRTTYNGNFCTQCGAKMDEDEWQEPEEPNINPCRGCDDYDGQGGCKSNGGCGTWIRMDEVK